MEKGWHFYYQELNSSHHKLNKKPRRCHGGIRKRVNMSRIRKLLSREEIVDFLQRFGELRIKVSHATLLEFSIVILILMLGFTVRLLPMRWGYNISEFDPYWQYRVTKDIVQNGYSHWATWQDTMSWWPWGRDVGRSTFPGLPMTAATFFIVLNALGIPMVSSITTGPMASDPVYNFVVIFPLIMATLTIIAIYFFGKDIGGKEVGLFAAFFLALNASYIGRTALGFFDDETIGIFGIVLFSLLFLRAIEKERPIRANLVYGIASGITLGYILASWGAARYPLGLAVLFVVVLLFLRRYSTRLLMAYSTTFSIALLIAINVPRLGVGFLVETTNVVVFGVFLLLFAIEISRHIKTARMKSIFALSIVALGVALFLTLYWQGYVQPLQGKYMSILNPFERLTQAAVASVQEHRPAAWGSIYYDVGIGILFVPVGFYFAAQNPTNRNIYLILFGLSAIYFASEMVRLLLILAPALCLLWALALTRVLKPFVTLLRETPAAFRRKMRLETHVGREFSAVFLIMIFLLLTFTFVFPSTESRAGGEPFPRVIAQAYVPTTISAASLPVKPDQTLPDWIDALNWMRYNLPPDAVVMSWWDYGYWIGIIANKTTLSDNATINATQMGRIGQMFLSPEADAIKIIDTFNDEAQSRGLSSKVNYVVAFFTFSSQGQDVGYGEESKWRWMANIAFDNLEAWKSFGNSTLGKDGGPDTNGDGRPDTQIDNPRGQNTTLYKMMMYGKTKRVSSIQFQLPVNFPFELVYWSQKDQSSVVTAGGINALVTVWEVRR